MAYTQIPLNVMTAQVKNKAAGLMMSDSMLNMEDPKEKEKDSIPSTTNDSVPSKKDKDLNLMKKLKDLNINFGSGKERPKEQIKKQLKK